MEKLKHMKRTSFVNTEWSRLKSVKKVTNSIPIEKYNSIVKFFASRSQIRKTGCTTAKISKYHILEKGNTGQDICRKIIDTDIGLSKHYRNINLDKVIPALSPILDSFKNRHNRCNYLDKLNQRIIKKYKRKQKTKYQSQIDVHLLQSFFSSLLFEDHIVPFELFGTIQNIKLVKKEIHRLLKTVPKRTPIPQAFKRTSKKQLKTHAIGAQLNIQSLFNKFDISKIEWLHSIKNNTEQWIIILKLLHWFFAQYVIKILHKYVVLISMKSQWVYIIKDDWCKLQEEFIKEKEAKGVLVTPVTVNESRWNLPTGTYKFIPSTSSLRALLLINRYSVEDKKGIDIVLRFLQQLYVTYFNRDGMPTVENCLQEIFKYKNSTSEPLYYVRCDIQDAFGSVNQVKLYNIINNSCDQLLHIKKQLSTYLTLRWYTLWKIRKNQCKIRKGETVQFLDLERTIKNASLSNKKPKVVRITKLLAKIKTLIFEHKVKINGKISSIKIGVPQGLSVSSIFSDIYYQYIINEKFPIFKNNGLLCTYVDDLLYITEKKHYAVKFLDIVMNGIPEYNVIFNRKKIESNVNIDLSYKPTRVTFLGKNIKL